LTVENFEFETKLTTQIGRKLSLALLQNRMELARATLAELEVEAGVGRVVSIKLPNDLHNLSLKARLFADKAQLVELSSLDINVPDFGLESTLKGDVRLSRSGKPVDFTSSAQVMI